MTEPGVAAERPSDMRPRVAALAAVVAFAVAVTGLAVVVARSGGGSGLERLPFAAATAERGDAAAMSLAAPAGPVDYVVEGTLPDLPDEAPAYRLGGDDVVADGVATATASVSDVAVSREPCPPCPPEADCLACGAPTPPVDLPSKADAERIARRALTERGLDAAGLELVEGGSRWQAIVAPTVGGLPTRGIETLLFVGPQGEVSGPYGYSGTPERIGDYPLVGVEAGLDRLRQGVGAGPQTLMARDLDAPEPDAVSSNAVQVVTITGARLALLRVGDVLVPVYEFLTEQGGALPVPAVTDRYLKEQQVPEPEPAPGGGGASGSCSGSAGASGSDGSNQPMSVEVCVEPARAEAGQEVVFTVTVVDPDARIITEGCGAPTATFGDEERAVIGQCMAACAAPPRFAPKPQPEPGKHVATHRHTYTKQGTYTARFEFQSTMCSPYSSRGEATVTVVVE